MVVKQLRSIFQVKVTLQGIKPPIWRRLLISSSMKLPDFHLALQLAMGWFDCHLHQFNVGSDHYGIPDMEWPDGFLDERQFTIGHLLQAEKDVLLYEYDFGDGWEHKIVLEKVLPFNKKMELPRCLKGKRACPPEDVGGPWGYQDFLEAMSDSEHQEHESVMEWIGSEFDPEDFDAVAISQILYDNF